MAAAEQRARPGDDLPQPLHLLELHHPVVGLGRRPRRQHRHQPRDRGRRHHAGAAGRPAGRLLHRAAPVPRPPRVPAAGARDPDVPARGDAGRPAAGVQQLQLGLPHGVARSSSTPASTWPSRCGSSTPSSPRSRSSSRRRPWSTGWGRSAPCCGSRCRWPRPASSPRSSSPSSRPGTSSWSRSRSASASRPSQQPLTVAINQYIGEYSVDWGHLFAAGLVATVPVIILFAIIERRVVGGLTAGGVK